jgi:hypothetical protein
MVISKIRKEEMKLTHEINELKPLNSIIQICPICEKIDAYKDDGHDCLLEKQNQESQEYYD